MDVTLKKRQAIYYHIESVGRRKLDARLCRGRAGNLAT